MPLLLAPLQCAFEHRQKWNGHLSYSNSHTDNGRASRDSNPNGNRRKAKITRLNAGDVGELVPLLCLIDTCNWILKSASNLD